MRDRIIAQRVARRTKSTLLLGPRQVGKSTLAQSFEPDFYLNLADEEIYLRYAKDKGLLKRELSTFDIGSLVVIDEIQRIPSLLSTVQALLDESPGQLRFLLTGSSARKLKRGSANLLPGRVVQEYLDPLTVFELGAEFDLDHALQLGMLPGILLDTEEPASLLKTYVDTYLREEIQAEALTRELGGYARFLDAIAIMSGSWLNYSKLSSDTEIPKETIRRFVSILEDTLIAFRVPPFKPRERITRRVSQRDKIILFDIGVRNALLGLHATPVAPNQIGSVFEQWLVLQIIYLNRAFRKNWMISSYRTAGGAEVDVVIESAKSIVAIEVKSGTNVSQAQTRGLLSLEETVNHYKPLHKWIAFRGERAQKCDNGTLVLPYLKVLTKLRDEI